MQSWGQSERTSINLWLTWGVLRLTLGGSGPIFSTSGFRPNWDIGRRLALGRACGHLGAHLGRPTAILARTWALLELTWSNLVELGPTPGRLGAYLSYSGINLGTFYVKLA